MKAYQADIAKFSAAGYQVYGVSADSVFALRRWSEDLSPETKGLSFTLLSDFKNRGTIKNYGLLNDGGYSMRATFVVDKEGKIQLIDEGNTAIDPTKVVEACTLVKK